MCRTREEIEQEVGKYVAGRELYQGAQRTERKLEGKGDSKYLIYGFYLYISRPFFLKKSLNGMQQ